MLDDLVYDGGTITWKRVRKFHASSGLPGYQTPGESCTRDAGPIPEGRYRLLLRNKGTARDDGTGRCNLQASPGIQKIPRGSAAGMCEAFWLNWGYNRVRLEPADIKTTHACGGQRGGFYLHDSTKGFSHGCIEVDGGLFRVLETEHRRHPFKKYLILNVHYKTTSTYGGTLKSE